MPRVDLVDVTWRAVALVVVTTCALTAISVFFVLDRQSSHSPHRPTRPMSSRAKDSDDDDDDKMSNGKTSRA